MVQLKEYNGKMYASAKELHNELGIKDNVSTWFNRNCKRAIFENEKDFIALKQESTGGRPSLDYLLTKESALTLVALSSGQYAKNVRLEIIKAFEEKQTGISLNVDQISALTDIVKAVTLVSNQKLCEGKHYYFYNQPETWWDYRAGILGYSKESLKEKLSELNIAYKSQKQALIHIQPSEIIRTSVIDLLISLGKGVEYALNVANFAKVIAEKNGYDRQIWDDTKPNPLGINKSTIEERKSLKIDKL
jgi:phage anti-repressor protein